MPVWVVEFESNCSHIKVPSYTPRDPSEECFNFLKSPLWLAIFHFLLSLFTLLLIPDKTKFYRWKFHKYLLDALEIPRASKTKTPGNFTLFSWSPLEIPLRCTVYYCFIYYYLSHQNSYIIASYVASYIFINIMKWNEVKLYFFQHNKCTFYILQLLKNIC